jgi:hypothetical protein
MTIAPGFFACTACLQVKAVEDFHRRKDLTRGHGSVCKPCKQAQRRAYKAPRDVETFWSRVRKDQVGTGCWEWTRGRTEGYGMYDFDGRTRLTHRIALDLAGIEVPNGMVVDHMCRNLTCCNPVHLRVVTPRVNALENNDTPFQRNAAKTHCTKCGTKLDGENVFWAPCKGPKGTPMATRICITCTRLRCPGTKRKPNTREEALALAVLKYRRAA